jgi:hypothetical protein
LSADLLSSRLCSQPTTESWLCFSFSSSPATALMQRRQASLPTCSFNASNVWGPSYSCNAGASSSRVAFSRNSAGVRAIFGLSADLLSSRLCSQPTTESWLCFSFSGRQERLRDICLHSKSRHAATERFKADSTFGDLTARTWRCGGEQCRRPRDFRLVRGLALEQTVLSTHD